MRRQVRSEVLKIPTVWSTGLIVGIAVVVMLLLALVVAFVVMLLLALVPPHRGSLSGALTPLRGSGRWFDNIFATMGVAQDLTLVLGILGVTSEYRYQTITPTYRAEPRRGRVTGVKVAESAAGGLLVAVVGGPGDLPGRPPSHLVGRSPGPPGLRGRSGRRRLPDHPSGRRDLTTTYRAKIGAPIP